MKDARAAIRDVRVIPRAEETIATRPAEDASKAALSGLDAFIDLQGAP